jgi:hypothetical protein
MGVYLLALQHYHPEKFSPRAKPVTIRVYGWGAILGGLLCVVGGFLS